MKIFKDIKNLKKIIWIFNGIIILIFIIILVDFFGLFGSKDDVAIQINEGDGISAISQKFKDEKIVLSRKLFSLYCKLDASEIKITPGEIKVNASMSYSELVKAIKKPSIETFSITVPEGFETREIADRLFSNDIINNENKFFSALKKYSFTLDDGTVISGEETSLNGYLFPDTYIFEKSSDPKDVIRLMTDNFKNHWKKEYSKQAKTLNLSVNDIVVLASIIEREGNNADDFKLISSVFHNRLKKGMRLESCATVQYILSERKPVLSIQDTKIVSPYNTYQNEGLPPTAIASPGIMAIEAALYPDKSDYLYFFTDKDGVTHFSRTLDEHNSLIRQYGL